jgi:hypothetical protein
MSFINDSILMLINILHVLVILFVVAAPFSDSNYFLLMHITIVPFIILHWILNNNTCCLTVAERVISSTTKDSKVEDRDCFTYQFIAPIYDFNKNYDEHSNFIYMFTIFLWFVSVYNYSTKLCNGNINNIPEAFRL